MRRKKGKYLISVLFTEERILLSKVNLKWYAMGHLYKDANGQEVIVKPKCTEEFYYLYSHLEICGLEKSWKLC